MKKASKILLIALLISALALTAVACNPDESTVDTRPETVADLVDGVLASQNSGWNSGLNDEEIMALPRPADYIVAREWALFAGDVILKSGLQEAKIKAITDYVLSDKGKAFLKGDGTKDVNHFIASFKEIGLTSTDVEGLVYDGVYAYIKFGGGVFESTKLALEKINNNPDLSASVRENVIAILSQTTSAMASHKHSSIDLDETLTLLESNETCIKTLVSFSYNTAMLFGNGVDGNLIDALTSGALTGASVSEIATYLGSVTASVKEIGKTIDENAEGLQSAIDSVLNFYNTVAFDSEIVNTLMMVIDNYKTLPTVLPLICDFVENVEEIALGDTEYKFVDNVMACFRDGYMDDGDGANTLIAYARIALSAVGVDYTLSDSQLVQAKSGVRDMIVGAMNQIIEGGSSGRGMMPIVYLAFLLNGESESEEIYGEPISRFANLVLADNYFNQFKRHYREYRSGVTDKADALISSANFLLKYAGEDDSVNVNTDFSEQWFESICNMATDKIATEMTALSEPSRKEMSDLAETLSTTVVEYLLDVASLEPQKVGTAEYDALKTAVENLYAQIAEAILG